jgi:predicted AAA+ superfamily ATPase
MSLSSDIRLKLLDFYSSKIPTYTPRETIAANIPDMITGIVGGRKSGKTYFTYQVIDKFISEKRISNIKDVCYLHFDDETLSSLHKENLKLIDKTFLSLRENDLNAPALFVFDEIHRIDGFEDFLLRLKKHPNWYVVVTGSTNKLEPQLVSKQLRGKIFCQRLHPLSFTEFLNFRNIPIKQNAVLNTEEEAICSRELLEYLKIGAYPAISRLAPEWIRELHQNYFISIVASDFLLSKKIENTQACKRYLYFLMQQNGCMTTRKKLLHSLNSEGFNLAPRTIAQWYDWSQEAFVADFVSIRSQSLKSQELHPKKVFTTDWGLARSVAHPFEDRLSRALESAVYWHLKRNNFLINYGMVAKQECDFVVQKTESDTPLWIQVSLSIDDPETRKRELLPLIKIKEQNQKARCLLITLDPTTHTQKGIETISALEFLKNTSNRGPHIA